MSKQKILDAAFESFSKGHYNSVSISEISQKAGIKKPSIYAHFDSKESLFLQVFEDESSKIYSKFLNLINENRGCDTKVILENILIESINYIRENKPIGGFLAYLFFVTSYDLPEKIIGRIEKFKNLMNDLISEIIQNGINKEELTKEEIDAITYFYYCLLQGNMLMELNSDIFDMDKVNKSWSYFWEGVRNKFNDTQIKA